MFLQQRLDLECAFQIMIADNFYRKRILDSLMPATTWFTAASSRAVI